jgi:hypothetical protein
VTRRVSASSTSESVSAAHSESRGRAQERRGEERRGEERRGEERRGEQSTVV